MRFSIARLIVATLLVNIVVCLTFAAPFEIGFPILTFISLVIIPPAMVVGVVNTRGARQAFFLGCMFAGLCHFVVSLYVAAVYSFGAASLSEFGSEDAPLRYVHLIGYTIGLTGGLSGVGMYYLVTMGQQTGDKIKSAPETAEIARHPLEDQAEEKIDSTFRSPTPR